MTTVMADDPGPDTEPIRLGKVVDSPATRQTSRGDNSSGSGSDSSDSSSGSDVEDDGASVSTAETVDQKSKVGNQPGAGSIWNLDLCLWRFNIFDIDISI